MILYSVTVKIENDVHDEWIHWMRTKHVPDVMATGHFAESRIFCIDEDEELRKQGRAYNFQYLAHSMESLQAYQKNHAAALQKEHTERYQGKFYAFRVTGEVVQTYKN